MPSNSPPNSPPLTVLLNDSLSPDDRINQLLPLVYAQLRAAAAALKPSDDLPPRAIEKVIARANEWEYRAPNPSDE